jgi:hypothetical protein
MPCDPSIACGFNSLCGTRCNGTGNRKRLASTAPMLGEAADHSGDAIKIQCSNLSVVHFGFCQPRRGPVGIFRKQHTNLYQPMSPVWRDMRHIPTMALHGAISQFETAIGPATVQDTCRGTSGLWSLNLRCHYPAWKQAVKACRVAALSTFTLATTREI